MGQKAYLLESPYRQGVRIWFSMFKGLGIKQASKSPREEDTHISVLVLVFSYHWVSYSQYSTAQLCRAGSPPGLLTRSASPPSVPTRPGELKTPAPSLPTAARAHFNCSTYHITYNYTGPDVLKDKGLIK